MKILSLTVKNESSDFPDFLKFLSDEPCRNPAFPFCMDYFLCFLTFLNINQVIQFTLFSKSHTLDDFLKR